MNSYKYVHYPNGGIVIFGKDTSTQVELNRLSRYLFGEGAAANQVFNCGVGAFIKFQNKPEVNKRRAFLLTKVWRYCNKRGIRIMHQYFKPKKETEKEQTDFNTIIKLIHANLEIHKG